VYGSFWVILVNRYSDTLAMWIAGVASVVGGLCYRFYYTRMMFGELLGLVWGFIVSGGAIPILNCKVFMVLLAIGCNQLIPGWRVLIMV